MEQGTTSLVERVMAKIRRSITLRLFTIGILILVLLIPEQMIESIISGREGNREAAVKEISDKWAGSQTITGPVLAIPYEEQIKDENGKVITKESFIYYLPDKLEVNGDMQSQQRHRGIYQAVLYESKLNMKGNFPAGLLHSGIELPASARLKDARILLGVGDVRGIRNSVNLVWNSEPVNARPGGDDEVVTAGINFPIGKFDIDQGGNFQIDLQLAGSGALDFTPVGKTTSVNITSNWASPSFYGSFLPTKDTITSTGFKAEWTVLELNRNFAQNWAGGNKNLNGSDFGVNMFIPTDEYQKTMRSIHYCVLFISLTFIFYFIIELRSGASVNPVQYLLIGLAISIFYLLLLSLSEWLAFNTSFFIAASAVTTLISLFSLGVFQSRFYAMVACIVQVLLYVFLFTTLQLEDLSLLIGSIGLFITLAILMYFSSGLNREKSVDPK